MLIIYIFIILSNEKHIFLPLKYSIYFSFLEHEPDFEGELRKVHVKKTTLK